MTVQMGEQVQMLDLDIWSGRTSPAHSAATTEKISKRSYRKSQGSPTKKSPIFLCLSRGSGATQEASMEWVKTDAPFPWHGSCTTPSSTECHKGDADYVCYVIGVACLPEKYYLTLNLSEKPRRPRPTKLSDILVTHPDPKYNLSARACQGILNRAQKRGKELPKELKAALMEQAKP